MARPAANTEQRPAVPFLLARGSVATARRSGEIILQLVERAAPAALMAVARGVVEKPLVMQRQQRAVPVGLQRHRHYRFVFRRRAPGPAEHQKPVRHQLPINAADFAMLAMFDVEADAVSAAAPRINGSPLGAGLDLGRPEPAGYFFRVGPRRVDFF